MHKDKASDVVYFSSSENNDILLTPMLGDNEFDLSFQADRFNAEQLPLLVLHETVLFAGITAPLELSQEQNIHVVKEALQSKRYIGLVIRIHENEPPTIDDFFPHGTLCEVIRELELPDGTKTVILQGKHPFTLEAVHTEGGALTGKVSCYEEEQLDADDMASYILFDVLKKKVIDISKHDDNPLPQELVFAARNITNQDLFINYMATAFPMPPYRRLALLETTSLKERGVQLLHLAGRCLAYCQEKTKFVGKAVDELSDLQRRTFLEAQIHSIQQALGNDSQQEIEKLLKIAEEKKWSDKVRKQFNDEVKKLRRTNEQSPDYSIQYSYIQTVVSLPWGKVSRDKLNLKTASRVLNHDHYGLEKVKERILEHLAVLKLRGDMRAPILCLIGPPGVGKTSLGRSIATALGREYVRISLGGIHDEAEIRGHRRTYIGAMPGRILSGIKRAGTDNPVFVLDEIDKLANDYKGDPSSALLEVLDPEQNTTFHDNYLDLDYDLSHVFFIATANNASAISSPLRDRMEIIDLSGYVIEEKVEIAMHYLLPKQKAENGLTDVSFTIPRATMQQIIEQYTRESGVRALERTLGKVMRKIALKKASDDDVPEKLLAADLETYLGKPLFNPDRCDNHDYYGVVTGLAWTAVGGCILEVESALVPGKGGLLLTGNLGEVMKESAQLALGWVKANAEKLQIDPSLFETKTAHIHFPEGATPKDGPSAGVTTVTSLVSTFARRKVRRRLAMTGEITLRGKVLPVGGIKEKILAARRAGVTDVMLPKENQKDIEEITPDYLHGLTFHYVSDLLEVLDFALV